MTAHAPASAPGATRKPKSKLKFKEFFLSFVYISLWVLIFGLWANRERIPRESYDLWSSYYVAPRVEAAEAEARQGHIDTAVASIQELLADHPDNPRLLHEMAALQFEREAPVPALFYAIAYLRSAKIKEESQDQELAGLLLADLDLGRYLSVENFGTTQEFLPLIDKLGIPVIQKAELKLHFDPDPRDKDAAHSLAEELSLAGELQRDRRVESPHGWAKVTYSLAAEILAPDTDRSAEDRAAGLIEITTPKLKAEGKYSYGHEWPRIFFVGGSLWGAVRRGVISAPAKEGGPGCCTLSLADPTLRPIKTVMSEYSAAQNGKSTAGVTAAGTARFFAYRERALLRQLYVLRFALESSITIEE